MVLGAKVVEPVQYEYSSTYIVLGVQRTIQHLIFLEILQSRFDSFDSFDSTRLDSIRFVRLYGTHYQCVRALLFYYRISVQKFVAETLSQLN